MSATNSALPQLLAPSPQSAAAPIPIENFAHIQHLVSLLMFVAQKNDPNDQFALGGLATPFHCNQNEPLIDLVTRLFQHIRCSTSCYAAALVYIDRITEANSDLPLNLRTVHLLFTTR
jgi:hypothetical protein